MHEFEMIEQLLKPLASKEPGALGLTDDAAFMPNLADTVLTADGMVEGIHFFPDTLPEYVFKKLIRRNVSDILAMGATPTHYLLTACLSSRCDIAWLEQAVAALADEQKRYGITLLGGDTSRHEGPLMLSMTMLGKAENGTIIRRSGAQAGDVVFVTGRIGDAALGLSILKSEIPDVVQQDRDHLIQLYHLPEPPLGFQKILSQHASAAIDCSDGLLADLSHLCRQSGLGAEIDAQKIPLSDSARRIVQRDPQQMKKILTGGDDYQLIFTAPEMHRDTLITQGQQRGIVITEIGVMRAGSGIVVQGGDTLGLEDNHLGFRHF